MTRLHPILNFSDEKQNITKLGPYNKTQNNPTMEDSPRVHNTSGSGPYQIQGLPCNKRPFYLLLTFALHLPGINLLGRHDEFG